MAIADQPIAAEQFPAELSAMFARTQSASARDPLTQCVRVLQKSFGENYAAASSPDGQTWPARKDPKAGGRSKYPGHPLLIDLGEMFLATTSSFGAGNITDVGDRDLAVGVDGGAVPYAAAQNYGNPERNLPQREFLGPSEVALDECEEILADWFAEKVL